ncbi:MAG: hypothetical protein JST19_11270 [Bacteroidetes bacterium]|nr:hypothetical protein [Bacteroidota bacterium]
MIFAGGLNGVKTADILTLSKQKIKYHETVKIIKMKNTSIIALIAFAICIFHFSCKKNSSPSPNLTIEYQILPVSNLVYITKIQYIDNTGTLITSIKPSSDFPNGSKSISISSTIKPFTARIIVFVSNPTNVTINNNVNILVDGQIKKTIEGNYPPGITNNVEVSYDVQ